MACERADGLHNLSFGRHILVGLPRLNYTVMLMLKNGDNGR